MSARNPVSVSAARLVILQYFSIVLQGRISAQQLDLADLASVRAAASALQRLPRIDYLILNAGVMVRQ